MPDGKLLRPPADTLQLLKLMAMHSEIVEMQLASDPDSARQAIEELPPAAPSVLDHLVQARVHVESQVLGEDIPTGLAAPLFADSTQAPVPGRPVERISTLDPEGWAASEDISLIEPTSLETDEPDVDLLELNAAEAGQPAEIDTLDELGLEAGLPAEESTAFIERTVEIDELLSQPLEAMHPSSLAAAALDSGETEEPGLDSAPVTEGDARRIEPLPEAAGLNAEADPDEGPGEDFQALLAGARQLEPGGGPQQVDEEDVPLLPAEGDVRLRARNGPKPGAEFVGKSTLAGAGGVYCLIEHFDLPAGTRMKVTLISPRLSDRFEIQDALVKRVRRAPENTTEVQLAFEQRHEDFEEFVAQHFGDQPVGFTLFSRRRPKR